MALKLVGQGLEAPRPGARTLGFDTLDNKSINNSYIYSTKRANMLDFGGENGTAHMQRLLGWLQRGGAPKPEAAQIAEMVNQNTGFTFTAPHLEQMLDRAYAAQGNAEANLTREIREWVLSTSGNFQSTQVNIELGLSTPVNKRKVSVVLGRLVSEGLIERVGKERGHFRVVDRSVTSIDWRSATLTAGLPILWPLDLHDRFETMPGSVIVVAGESNSGKSAWMLATAQMNLASGKCKKISYFASSNESNALTLRKRIDAFGLPDSAWEGFEASRPGGEFADVIDPEGLNLIDYLEVHSDFYEIGGKLAAISEKLRDGVAVVGIQKAPGVELARGGAMTLDKATAYLALHRGDVANGEAHTLKLPKVKYPKVDYASKPIKFKLAGGCRFVRA
ncbi:hypothetical protein [Desulfarculus baarsii]|nr:hypothetical protein [Desulfarculus baarsii]